MKLELNTNLHNVGLPQGLLLGPLLFLDTQMAFRPNKVCYKFDLDAWFTLISFLFILERTNIYCFTCQVSVRPLLVQG